MGTGEVRGGVGEVRGGVVEVRGTTQCRRAHHRKVVTGMPKYR